MGLMRVKSLPKPKTLHTCRRYQQTLHTTDTHKVARAHGGYCTPWIALTPHTGGHHTPWMWTSHSVAPHVSGAQVSLLFMNFPVLNMTFCVYRLVFCHGVFTVCLPLGSNTLFPPHSFDSIYVRILLAQSLFHRQIHRE